MYSYEINVKTGLVENFKSDVPETELNIPTTPEEHLKLRDKLLNEAIEDEADKDPRIQMLAQQEFDWALHHEEEANKLKNAKAKALERRIGQG